MAGDGRPFYGDTLELPPAKRRKLSRHESPTSTPPSFARSPSIFSEYSATTSSPDTSPDTRNGPSPGYINYDCEELGPFGQVWRPDDPLLRCNRSITEGAEQGSECASTVDACHEITLDIICYGMILVKCDAKYIPPGGANTSLSVRLGSAGALTVDPSGEELQPANRSMMKVLEVLSKEGVEFEMKCSNPAAGTPQTKGRFGPQFTLSVILYGALDLFEDVGDFLEEAKLRLQVPIGAQRNVPYRNPHCFSGDDPIAPMTKDIHGGSAKSLAPRELLTGFNTNHSLPEAPQPSILTTRLCKHQKQALSFMQRRECGWAMESKATDIWSEIILPCGSKQYLNNVSTNISLTRPSSFQGGILADNMGLGKSLSMISLIAADAVECSNNMCLSDFTGRHKIGLHRVKATLLVVPPALLDHWEKQFESHVQPGSLIIHRHHGASRITNPAEIENYDVVMTTYHTVSRERKHGGGKSILFSTLWHRIVLDEAHFIRERTTEAAKSATALHGSRRWAVTGTPIQNGLADFTSLLAFLQLYPYADRKTFDAHITNHWKNDVQEGARRLKKLIGFIMLRRSNETISLPPRTDLIRTLNFSPEERRLYEEKQAQTIRFLDNAIQEHNYKPASYLNILQWINTLRLVCNLGVSVKSSSSKVTATPKGTDFSVWDSKSAQSALDGLLSMGSIFCTSCSLDVESAGDYPDVSHDTHQIHLSQCLRALCNDCYVNRASNTGDINMHPCKQSECQWAPVSLPAWSNSSEQRSSPPAIQQEIPTKIKALLNDLKTLETGVKSIVFSFWTSTLDIIERELIEANISYVRYDGRVRVNNRETILNHFREDPTIRVLLMTFSCGAVGLNLTAASRAYLIEPQWNPTTEEQALARVHRMGQTKNVTTIRYIMKDSFEDHVMKVQERKKHLADLVLSEKNVSTSQQSHAQLLHLRSLIT